MESSHFNTDRFPCSDPIRKKKGSHKSYHNTAKCLSFKSVYFMLLEYELVKHKNLAF